MKTYSDKFINQSNKLKDSKVGFEFEFYTKDISFYKTLELLNQELAPVKVWGFREYHSDFVPDEKNFKIEPDLSGGSNMVELVTGPLKYFDAKYYLVKIIKFIQNYGYTNERSSIHFNISFDNESKNLNDLNVLKLILNIDEDEIYRNFPSRKNNVYAKTVKKIIPYKEYDFFNISVDVVKNNLRLPNDKYYGINFSHINGDKDMQRLEFRYIGGKDYEKNLGLLIYFLDRFIIDTWNSIDIGFNSEDTKKLQNYLELNISRLRNFAKYDNFIVDLPSIHLQVDQSGQYEVVSAYYTKIFSKIFEIIDSTENLKECIINYVTSTQLIEVVDADVKSSTTIRGFDFINCRVEGIFENCFFVGCEIDNSQLVKSKLQMSDANKSKVLSCKVESSQLTNCYFQDGYLNGDMFGGVYRSGKLGPNATMDSETKVVTEDGNFFDTRFEEETKGDQKGVIKGWGKK